MENHQGTITILKKEETQIPESVASLINDLSTYDSEFDERVLESIGKTVGFYSSDDKVYKLLSCYIERMADSIISSVNETHKKEIEAIAKKITDAESDMKMPLKRKNNIKLSCVSSRVFTLEDLVGELNDRGVAVGKTTQVHQGNVEAGLGK
jgi:hypothetical protein